MNTRVRNYCFTWNNHPPRDDVIKCFEPLDPQYVVFGYEVAPTTGTPHIQGYIEFKKAMTLNVLVRERPGIHWEPRMGTAYQASFYCKKGGKYEEFGTPKAQGARTDLTAIREEIENGSSLLHVANNHFGDYLRYHRGIERYMYVHRMETMRDLIRSTLRVVYLWGPTGTGKTRTAWSMLTRPYVLNEGNTGFWWTGYQSESDILIDDFRGTTPLHILLRWLDIYPCQVPIHGGYAFLCATTIIITSNLSLDQLYRNCDEGSRQALRRRFSEIRYIGTEVTGNSSVPSLLGGDAQAHEGAPLGETRGL